MTQLETLLQQCTVKIIIPDALFAWLSQSVPWAHRTHLTTCLWMVAALSISELRHISVLGRILPGALGSGASRPSLARGVAGIETQECLNRFHRTYALEETSTL
jgi:hypothetical protein